MGQGSLKNGITVEWNETDPLPGHDSFPDLWSDKSNSIGRYGEIVSDFLKERNTILEHRGRGGKVYYV